MCRRCFRIENSLLSMAVLFLLSSMDLWIPYVTITVRGENQNKGSKVLRTGLIAFEYSMRESLVFINNVFKSRRRLVNLGCKWTDHTRSTLKSGFSAASNVLSLAGNDVTTSHGKPNIFDLIRSSEKVGCARHRPNPSRELAGVTSSLQIDGTPRKSHERTSYNKDHKYQVLEYFFFFFFFLGEGVWKELPEEMTRTH
jgi:hypothetical protein